MHRVAVTAVLLGSFVWIGGILFGTSLYAQAAVATLSGTVTDETGAVIPDVVIVIRNVSNSAERRLTTDRVGTFAATFLSPGQYVVTASQAGFSTAQVPNVLLNVNDQINIVIPLKIQSSVEAVTVVAEASRASTATSVGTIVDRRFIADIPLNGRTLQPLIQLVPGAVLTSGDSTGGAASFSVNGQRPTANYFTVDGVSANTGISSNGSPMAAGAGVAPGTTALGTTSSLASLDEVQEFRMETSTFAAEFGRTPGGQIALVTRSGTDTLHGSVSESFRHDAMDASDWFANSRNLPKPKMRQNLFGGVLGGPLWPSRVFFFGSYEGLRLEQPTTKIVAVPTAEIRAQSPSGLRLYLDALPLPNGPATTDGFAEFAASYSDPASSDVSALRVDVHGGNGIAAFVRINHAPSQLSSRTGSLSTMSSVKVKNDAITGGITWASPSRLTADLRLNWTRNLPQAQDNLVSFGGSNVPAASDIFLPGRTPGHEYFTFGADDASFGWGVSDEDTQRQLNIVGTLALAVGRHQSKFGFDYRRVFPRLGGAGALEALYIFGGAQAITSGLASYYYISSVDPRERVAVLSNLSLFAQDTYSIGRRLTLSYGLRFERVPPPTEAGGRTPPVLLGIENDTLENPRLAPAGTPLWRDHAGEFAPRLGVAYQLSAKPHWETTLRAGTGVFYDLGLGIIANAFQNVYPFYASASNFDVPFPLPASSRVPPSLGVDPPGGVFAIDPNVRLPYTVQWSAAWEQTLGGQHTVTMTYVGAAGRRLLLARLYNQPLEEWPDSSTSLYIQRNRGRSRYDALQFQYHARLVRGLQILASYSLATARDNGSTDGDFATPPGTSFSVARTLTPSSFDVRHQLSTAIAYDLPTPTGAPLFRVIFGHWGVDAIFRAQTGLPFNPESNTVFVETSYVTARPDRVAGEPLYLYDSKLPGGRRVNPDAFSAPPTDQQGNSPRNSLRGFGLSQLDCALRRQVPLTGSVMLEFRAEMFNALNHPNFGPLSSSINSSLFGQPTAMLNSSLGGLNALYQVGGPRSSQLSIRLLF